MTSSLAHDGAGLGTCGLPESNIRALAAEAGFGTVTRVAENPFNVLYALTTEDEDSHEHHRSDPQCGGNRRLGRTALRPVRAVRQIVTDGLGVHGEQALRMHPPRHGERVLDVGCGFGDTTRQLASWSDRTAKPSASMPPRDSSTPRATKPTRRASATPGS